MFGICKGGAAAGFLFASSAAVQAMTLTPLYADCDPLVLDRPFATALHGCGVTPDRTDVDAVNLGGPDGDFFSLGLADDPTATRGGVAIFSTDVAFTGTIGIAEVTNPSNHWEAARVYVGNSLAELEANYLAQLDLGIVDNGKAGTEAANESVSTTGIWTYIMIEDVSREVYGSAADGNSTVDGFDLDSLELSPVPLPGAVLMLGTALVGMGALRRRR